MGGESEEADKHGHVPKGQTIAEKEWTIKLIPLTLFQLLHTTTSRRSGEGKGLEEKRGFLESVITYKDAIR